MLFIYKKMLQLIISFSKWNGKDNLPAKILTFSFPIGKSNAYTNKKSGNENCEFNLNVSLQVE